MNDSIEKHDVIQKMIPKTELKPADLLIVFGTTYGLDLFVSNIVDFYKAGFIKKYILCTGGNEFIYNKKEVIESILMKELLIKNGIPNDIILTETKSKNTGENLAFSVPILQQAFGKIKDIKSIIGVGKIHATLRFLMTMSKYFPEQKKMFFPVDVFNGNRKLLYEKLLIERKKIPEYLKKGYICNLDEKTLLLNNTTV